MNTYIKQLNWRYAVKQFDNTKKISEEDLNILKEAIQLSASSYGLQPYKVIIVEDKATREQLKAASWNQSQITDASHMIVLANMTDADESLVDNYIDNVSETRGIAKENLTGYSDMMKSNVVALPTEVKDNWTAKQAYIALGNLLSAAAFLKIDACPMEGFDSKAYNQILGLEKENLNAAVVITLGYRAEEDQTQHYKKVRKPENELFSTI
ncbi:NAD(P)H-dependent oxidoreductase [Formosa sp. S-31]|uniref:NAD(P)H-dependent oxidoreductase n=1 Tax=Formosa sp. S-31 TaxID=2790949 RepID=UPI003EBC3437